MTTEVWLYGSAARGDNDAHSDVDVLVAGHAPVAPHDLPLRSAARLSMSRYSWEELEHMASYGSLFLHHVRLEGRPLLESPDRKMATLLRSMGPYRRADQELDCFAAVLDDVEDSLQRDCAPPFELSVVATAARHAAILGCYLLGEPDFGRVSAFRRLLPRLGYRDDAVDGFIDLYRYRRFEDENRQPEVKPSAQDVHEQVANVRRLIQQVRALAAQPRHLHVR